MRVKKIDFSGSSNSNIEEGIRETQETTNDDTKDIEVKYTHDDYGFYDDDESMYLHSNKYYNECEHEGYYCQNPNYKERGDIHRDNPRCNRRVYTHEDNIHPNNANLKNNDRPYMDYEDHFERKLENILGKKGHIRAYKNTNTYKVCKGGLKVAKGGYRAAKVAGKAGVQTAKVASAIGKLGVDKLKSECNTVNSSSANKVNKPNRVRNVIGKLNNSTKAQYGVLGFLCIVILIMFVRVFL